MKNFFKIIFCIIVLFITFLYLGIVILLPKIVNSKASVRGVTSFLHKKCGIELNVQDLNLKVSPTLTFVLSVSDIEATGSNGPVLELKNVLFNYNLLKNNFTVVKADNLYIDGNYLKELIPSKKSDSKLNLNKFSEVHIKNLNYASDEVNIFIQNIDTIKDDIQLKAKIKTPYLRETIELGNSGTLQVLDNTLSANKFEIKLGNSQIFLDGILINKDKMYDFDLKGENLPLSELMPILLHFQKSQDPAKKFIENFRDFTGYIRLDLHAKNSGIFGTCTAYNLGAKAVWFDIPLYFKQAIFNFNGESITSKAEGILGKEKVIHTLNITNLGTEKKEVVGTLNTKLTKRFNYVPNLTVLNSVNVGLVYKIKAKKVDVFYDVDITENSDLIYNTSYLGLRNYKRKISAHTFKDNNDLHLKEYKYSYIDKNKENIIVSGDGLFVKINEKFTPQFLSCNTNGYAPITVTGSFGEKIRGGEFSGNLEYNYINDTLVGTFDVINARYKAFEIEKAHVDAQNGIVNITAKGLFKGEKYLAEMKAKNDFANDVLIYNTKLFLNKLLIDTNEEPTRKHKKIHSKDFVQKIQQSNITVNNLEMVINEIKREAFVLNNVKLFGSLKNNIFDFTMKELDFADGKISANGNYNFKTHTSDMVFTAENINSNKAAEMMLNLENQIDGMASAKVNLSAKDMFRFLDVHCDFDIKEGFFPKLGDAEFMLENTKYKLSQIINFDLTQKDLMKADIKGSFDVHSTELNNVDITAWSEDSAMYLEGDYEMEKQYANLQLFWHYSKNSPKGVRIFCVPLSWILKIVFRPEKSREIYQSKLAKIPKINEVEDNTSYYRVQLKGDINNNKMDLIFKEIK
jgi:hypothetical protein